MTENELAKLLQGNPDLAVDDAYFHQPVIGLAMAVPILRQSEHDLQAALIAECDRRAATNPLWGLILAIPNGQYRKGQRMEPGLRPGVPDLLLPIERHGYIGMFLELKVNDNPLSPMQEVWLSKLAQQGYYCVVIRDSLQSAIQIIDWYLRGK